MFFFFQACMKPRTCIYMYNSTYDLFC